MFSSLLDKDLPHIFRRGIVIDTMLGLSSLYLSHVKPFEGLYFLFKYKYSYLHIPVLKFLFNFSEIYFSESRKRRTIIIASGYRFRNHHGTSTKTYWKCSTHFKNGCRAVIHTSKDNKTILKYVNVHNH